MSETVLDKLTRWKDARQLVTDGHNTGRVYGYVVTDGFGEAFVELTGGGQWRVAAQRLRPLELKPVPRADPDGGAQ